MGFVVAIVLAAASAALAFGGTAVQALEARNVSSRQALRASLLTTLLRRPLWLAGTAANIVAFALQIVALSLSSLAIVQPVFAVGLIVLALIAVWRLGEHLGRREYAGGAAIIAGLALVALVAPRRNHLPLDVWFDVSACAALLACVVALFVVRLRGRSDGLTTSVCAGLLYAWLGVGGTLLSESFSARRWGLLSLWAGLTIVSAVLAVLAEMTALQTWPVTRSKPVVFVLQTIGPAVVAPFFASSGFGPLYGVPFALALAVVGAGSVAVGSSAAIAEVASG
jgi:drug/metabolite transporter (DMT)-like permease